MAMPLPLLSDSARSALPCNAMGSEHEYRMEWVGVQHHERASLERFIGEVFFEMYQAKVHHFCDTLVGCRDKDGQWVAALGYSLARDGRAFLEQYLDAPLESEIASRISMPVSRHHIVEVGNMAAKQAGAARALIVCMTRYLHQQGLVWVAFTATRSLLNSFLRLRLKPLVLANADPRRLADAGKSWGTYYDAQPQVMFGDIRSGYAQLAE